MKNITLISLLVLFSFSLIAQETRTEKKTRETAERDAYRIVQEKWADDKTFVLEAQQVYNKAGEMFQLTPSTNFVHINNDDAIVQLSFNHLVGWNGVGGITIKGKITKYEAKKDKKNTPIYIRMTIQGSEGFHDITLWLSTSGRGEAEVKDIRGNRIKFTGDIVSLENTNVFIGNSR